MPPTKPPPELGLRDIQSLMAQALMRPLVGGDRMQRISGGTAVQIIKPNDRLNSFERLQIYNQQYWWRLLASFNDDYRGVRAVLGERKFDKLALAYLEAHGSTSWSLRDLGALFPAFISEHPELTVPYSALAHDMARVEWAKISAFDAPTLPVVDPQVIADRDPARLRLAVQPCISLLALQYPIDRLLKKLRDAYVETASNAVSTGHRRALRTVRSAPSSQPIYLAVHRIDFSIYYKRLEPGAFKILQSLRGGASLADACSHGFEGTKISDKVAAAQIAEWFSHWTQMGWLARASGQRRTSPS